MIVKSVSPLSSRNKKDKTKYSFNLRKGARAMHLAKEGVLETIYPTRCAVCDKPGTLLCDECTRALPYVDMSMACKVCGAAWGVFQCSECNPLTLSQFGLEELPFVDCVSALHSNAVSRRIVRAYKDNGERRLASVIAQIMAAYISDDVAGSLDAITYIPARRDAARRRGYDHMQLVAHNLSEIIGVGVATTLAQPRGLDQRDLGRLARMSNTHNLFVVHPQARVRGAKILLIDDVMTTGSTLISAASVLKSAGASAIYLRSFARG